MMKCLNQTKCSEFTEYIGWETKNASLKYSIFILEGGGWRYMHDPLDYLIQVKVM